MNITIQLTVAEAAKLAEKFLESQIRQPAVTEIANDFKVEVEIVNFSKVTLPNQIEPVDTVIPPPSHYPRQRAYKRGGESAFS